MSVDRLQEKIRKLKNPFLLDLAPDGVLPQEYGCTASAAEGWGRYFCDLLEGLKGKLPGVRFSFGSFALLGPEGLAQLQVCLHAAAELGYYVLLDAPELWSIASAQQAVRLLEKESLYPCDGLVIPGYLGSDLWKPFLPFCKEEKKDIYIVARTGNKSAPEIQDLLTGSRLVHMAAADHINRYGGDCVGRCGYSRVGALAAASSQESLRNIRGKYPRLFLLVDGLDYSGGNVKNCAAAFDKLGHGAAICSGVSLHSAWRNAGETVAPVQAAVDAADRLRKNIARYVAIL